MAAGHENLAQFGTRFENAMTVSIAVRLQ